MGSKPFLTNYRRSRNHYFVGRDGGKRNTAEARSVVWKSTTGQARFVFLFRKNGLVPFVITQQNKAHDVSLECSTKQCSAVCALVRIVANKY